MIALIPNDIAGRQVYYESCLLLNKKTVSYIPKGVGSIGGVSTLQ